MDAEPTIILLFVIASAVAVASRRLRIPYTVSLVLVGLALGALQLVHAPILTRDMLFMIFLPGLIFEAAFNLNFERLRRDWLAVLGLALPGVVVSIGLTAALLVYASEAFHIVLGTYFPVVSWPLALVFGAAVAATDPISVVALFRRLDAPPRLTLLLEGESLLNDGTAIVFFGLILAVLAQGSTSVSSMTIDFGRVVGGGILVGSVVGLLVSLAMQRVNDAMVEITLTTVAAYGSFLIADQLGFSGVISTVTAGLICGNYAARTAMSPTTRVATHAFWAYLGFALNSLVFLLMGFEIHPASLLAVWPLILLSWIVVTLARGGVIFGTVSLLSLTAARIPPSWGVLLTWGGLRGALSMVLALSLPQDLPLRELIINMVFGFVLLSILVQGLSMTGLARRLGLLGERDALLAYEVARTRLRLATDVMVEIGRLRTASLVDPATLDTLEAEYRQSMAAANAALSEVNIDDDLRLKEDLSQLRRRLLQFEQGRLMDARQRGDIAQAVHEQLLADVDARHLQMEANGNPADRLVNSDPKDQAKKHETILNDMR
ncbi:sodium:proton antiporter [Halothiobacillus sp.]|uniref:cation:proton antiporter n=1 Tax=Halothiobacillus sp. TaxID=1891311 RepID=UPI002AD3BBAD|nr:sodium:proton antiporter [Halothiobacillus sp.]